VAQVSLSSNSIAVKNKEILEYRRGPILELNLRVRDVAKKVKSKLRIRFN
jgi:hypothetical protein